jgi:serine/threonine-protein kinase
MTADNPVQQIGKYEILAKLGQGGMGVVYKAKDPKIDRLVAIKTITARMDSDPELRERFRLEARSAAQISHKNVITIYDYDEADGHAYLVMEFLEGEDLRTKIERRDPMPLVTKLRIIREVGEGLAHAHRMGIVHRDIKPGNIFITTAGQVKILDFGLARVVSSDLTRSGVVVGTPAYMSPEQLRAERVDQRSDIFSAGVVFYELLTLINPFHGDSDFAISLKIVQSEPVPIEALNPAIPPDIAALVHRAIQKDPARRYPNFDEFLADLSRTAAGGAPVADGSDELVLPDPFTTVPGARAAPGGPASASARPGGQLGLVRSPSALEVLGAPAGRPRSDAVAGSVVDPRASGMFPPGSSIGQPRSPARVVADLVASVLLFAYRVVDIVLITVMLGLLVVFALEFLHSKKIDALAAVRLLHDLFDPRIREAATWFDISWNPGSQSFVPAGLAVGILIFKLLLGVVVHSVIDLIAKMTGR